MVPIDTCEPFFEYVGKYMELDPDTKQLVASQFSEISFPPKHIILSEGGNCDKAFFVISGTARIRSQAGRYMARPKMRRREFHMGLRRNWNLLE